MTKYLYSLGRHIWCKFLGGAFLACVLVTSNVMASGVSVEASIEPPSIALGNPARLVVTVFGTQDVNPPQIPAVDGLEVKYSGPSTQIRVINGEYSSFKSFNYSLVPVREGQFVVPALDLLVKGQTYSTSPVILNVSASAVANDQADETGFNQNALADKVRMFVMLPDEDVFVNEEIPLTIKFLVQNLPIQNISFPSFEPEGFILSDFSRPRQYREEWEGRPFDVVEFTTRLTPTRSGEVKVGPAKITADLLFKDNRRHDFFGAPGMDNDFFSGFFNTYQKKPFTITSAPIHLAVKPLPDLEGPHVLGGVGSLMFDAQVSPTKVRAGDPVTLRMMVSGEANLKSVQMPEFKDEKFKAYDPKIREEDGKKSLEQVIIPLDENVKQVPAISFLYFDTKKQEYVTLTKGPFLIEVTPLPKGEEFQVVGFSNQPVNLLKENIGRDIVFVKDKPGRLMQRHSWWQRNGWFLTILFLYMSLWFAAFIFYKRSRRFAMDPAYARRSGAFQCARRKILDLKSILASLAPKEFYSRLIAIFESYLFDKVNTVPDRSDYASVAFILSPYPLDDKSLGQLRAIYHLAEQACFASGMVKSDAMERSLLDMEAVIVAIEGRIR